MHSAKASGTIYSASESRVQRDSGSIEHWAYGGPFCRISQSGVGGLHAVELANSECLICVLFNFSRRAASGLHAHLETPCHWQWLY